MEYNKAIHDIAIQKLETTMDELLWKLDGKKFENETDIKKAYIEEAFNLLVQNFVYDNKSTNAVKKLKTLEEKKKLYSQLISLEKCVLENTGVCRQFSEYLLLLTANERVTQEFGSEIYSSKIQCKIHCPSGDTDAHAINRFVFDEKDLFCDLSMGVHNRDNGKNTNDFLLKPKQEYKNNLLAADGSVLDKKTISIHFAPDTIGNLYDFLINFDESIKNGTIDHNRFDYEQLEM